MDPSARWIWIENGEEKNCYADFKTSFEVPFGSGAELEITADGTYAVWVNDRFVDCGQYPDYPEYKSCDRFSLPVREGKNDLLIRVWHPGETHFSYRAESPGLLFTVYSGDRMLAVSDGTVLAAPSAAFRAGSGEKITFMLGYTFFYDARLAGTESFQPARVTEKEARLVPRPVKKTLIGARAPEVLCASGVFWERPWETVGQRMQNASLAVIPDYKSDPAGTVSLDRSEGDGIFFVFDLQKEQAGYPELDLILPRDALVLVGWGEHLRDLQVRTYVGRRNFVFSYYGTAGENRFFMPLRRIGLRYLQIHVYAPSAVVRYAGIRPEIYPLEEHFLPITDRLHRKIYEVCVQTLRNCMHDHYEDTPWREQGLYTMDSRNEMLCCYDAFHETEFPKACLRLIGLGVREDGRTELCSPSRFPRNIPGFSAVWLIQLGEYLSAAGDTAFLREMLPAARRVASVFEERIDASGLIPAFPGKDDWNFYEWQPGLDGERSADAPPPSTYDAPLCALVSMGFAAMEQICSALDLPDDAARYRRLRETLNSAAHQAFWCGTHYHTYREISTGETRHSAQLTQALMICCGACPPDKIRGVREILKRGDGLIPVTLSASIFKYDALMTDPDNREWMWDDIAKIWGDMLFCGATSFWETAQGEGAFGGAGSLCHGWSAVPLHLYHKYGMK